MSELDDIQFTEGEIGFILHRLRLLKAAASQDLHSASLDDTAMGRLHGLCNSIDIVGNVLEHGKEYRLIKDKGRYFEEPERQTLLMSEGSEGVNGAYLCNEAEAGEVAAALLENGNLVTRFWVISDDRKFTIYRRSKEVGESR
ncbi:hypothetical protein [Deinococcus phoenicis]|uniref:hypothetical protein n=1 Tax=Deinococcus phoenicis TaxID=1476583 RepID=UPI001268A9F2|nr:hypothetical protein [Deinococcus phoenicis]